MCDANPQEEICGEQITTETRLEVVKIVVLLATSTQKYVTQSRVSWGLEGNVSDSYLCMQQGGSWSLSSELVARPDICHVSSDRPATVVSIGKRENEVEITP